MLLSLLLKCNHPKYFVYNPLTIRVWCVKLDRYLYDRLCAARRFCLDVATKKATQPSHRVGGLIQETSKQEAVSEVRCLKCAARRFCLNMATKKATRPSHRVGGLIQETSKQEAVSEVRCVSVLAVLSVLRKMVEREHWQYVVDVCRECVFGGGAFSCTYRRGALSNKPTNKKQAFEARRLIKASL